MAARSNPREDTAKLDALEKAGKLKRVPFKDRAEMKKLVDPVMAAYAKEIGADDDPGEDQRDRLKPSRRPRRARRICRRSRRSSPAAARGAGEPSHDDVASVPSGAASGAG